MAPLAFTIKDIARQAKASTATVSRVLNNKPGVTEEKRRLILALAEQHGYSPNRIAQNLATKKSHLLGFIAADLQNHSYVESFRHVQHRVEELGYQVLIADSEQNLEKEKHNIRVMRQHRAEGILLFPVHDWHEKSSVDHLLRLQKENFPFVLIGKIDDHDFNYVSTEEIEAARKLTQHLIDLGHREIAFVGWDASNRPVHERYTGYERALQNAGIDPISQARILLNGDWPGQLKKLLKARKRPTALVMINDVLTLQAQKIFHEAGVGVPRDLSVVAFGAGEWLMHLQPAVTASVENNVEVARTALEMLLKKMENPSNESEQRLIAQKLVIRESTKHSAKKK
ncbi:MAG: LacI family DNA-binding transcriptional regulator [Candidatus Sumerlaeota bacterium]